MIAAGGIPKPSFDAFKLLHELGTERLLVNSDSVLVTRRPDGSLVLAVWNLISPEMAGTSTTVNLRFEHLGRKRRAYVSRVDRDHGDVNSAYQKMGQPPYPTREQIQLLRKAADLGLPEVRELRDGGLTVEMPPNGLALIEIR